MPTLSFIAVLCFVAAACSTIPSVGFLLIMAGIGSIILSVCLDL